MPDVVFRASGLGPTPFVLTGADTVARNARAFGPNSPPYCHVLVNGGVGVVVLANGVIHSVTAFTVSAGRITAIDVLGDRDRLARIQIPIL